MKNIEKLLEESYDEREKAVIAQGHDLGYSIHGDYSVFYELSAEQRSFIDPLLQHPAISPEIFTHLPIKGQMEFEKYWSLQEQLAKFGIDESLTAAFCFIIEKTKKLLWRKRSKMKKQDYAKLQALTKRFHDFDFPKSVTIKFEGRSDSITVTDTDVLMSFWDAFCENVHEIDIVGEEEPVEKILLQLLTPLKISRKHGTALTALILQHAGSSETIDPSTYDRIRKRVSKQSEKKGKRH